MNEDYDDEFFCIDQLLMEESMLNSCQDDYYCIEEEYEEYFSNLEQNEGQETHENSEFLTEEEAHVIVNKHKPQLKLEQKRFIVDTLLTIENEGSLPYGTQAKLARQVGVHKSTIGRILKDIWRQGQMGHVVDIRSKKFGRTGPKPKEYSNSFLQSVPLHKRTTERSFAAALKVSHVTVHRLKKRGKLRSHTSNNHPSVTPSHKLARMQWVLSRLTIAENSVNHTFIGMYNVIHIDEKLFYLNPEMRRFYLLPSEDDPYRCQQSKRYKIKAMFMGVISRPIFDQEGNMIHDGKYGIFPFIYHERAKKNSKNRAAGTMETKAIQNISRDVIRDMLLQKVVPTIMDKWPEQMGKEIIIQWDNARPHQIPTDEQFRQATTQNGFDIKLVEGGNNYKIPHVGKRRLESLGILPESVEVCRSVVNDAVTHLNNRLRPIPQHKQQQQNEDVDAD